MPSTTSADLVLFQDDFSGSNANALNGMMPDVTQGSTAWVADTEYKADGAATSGQVSRRAYLSLGGLIDDNRGNPDAIYTLSGRLSVVTGTTTIWEAIGFWNQNAPAENFGSTPSNGTAWMLRRANAQLRVFRGLKTNGTLSESTASPNNITGTLDLKVVLDLSSWNGSSSFGTVTYFAKLSTDPIYTEIASGALDATNSTFRAVGIGGGAVAARFEFFQLSKLPDPVLKLSGFRYDRADPDGASQVSIDGRSGARLKLVEADDLDFTNPDQDPVPLTGSTAGTLDGNEVILDGNGGATVQFDLGTSKDAAFIRAQETIGPVVPGAPRYYQPAPVVDPVTLDYEVAVYGGTPGGVTAAIQAARMGKKTVLLSFDGHVGGLTSGGLTATDLGDQTSIGGMAGDFYQVVGFKDFRPSAAEARYLAMLNEAGVTVLFRRCLASVAMQENHIISATMETGETITADMFIDATYEGDLLAAAKVSYHVGREPSATYAESLAGQWQTVSWAGVYQFCGRPISPYKVAGKPASGLLPEIMNDPAGNPGDGDHRVQAYNFRMHLSNAADRVPFPKPAGYDPARYGLLARFLNEPGITWTLNYTTAANTDGPVQMRNGDSNNAGSFSSDYVGGCNRWPDGTFDPASFSTLPAPRRGLAMPFRQLYELREGIFQDHVRYQMGHLYFLANDPQVPTDLRNRVNAWGLRANEFVQTANWPHQLYVREGRRMVSDYVMTQANCQSTVTASDSVGLASYAMDSHFCQRVVVVENGVTTVRNEGGFGKPCPKPYPVSYRSIIPKKSECDNLLVAVCLSASHVAYGSIRMEPVFMILGQSAGTAATLAIDNGQAVQDVNYAALRARLLADGQKL